MVERARLNARVTGGGNYFSSPKTHHKFISTGCKVLDLALGGGWALGRVGNIVGDKSTGKTLLCIEAAANFAEKYSGKIYYRESEAAFDKGYAEALGMPIKRISFGKDRLETVEDFYEDLHYVLDRVSGPSLYILDSLDALSDRAEMKRKIDEGSFGAAKAKQMSELFRRLTARVEESEMMLLIVSQVRDNIGAMFGRKTKRSGGRALDFYASQVLYLAQIGMLHRTINKVKRPTGITIRAKVDKNKIAKAYHEAEFPILFGYGIDDERACVDWLDSVGVKNVSESESLARLHEIVERKWWEIESAFLPKKSKYGNAEA